MRIIIGTTFDVLAVLFSLIHDLHIVFIVIAEERDLRTRLFIEVLFDGDIHIERLLGLQFGIALEQPAVSDGRGGVQ